MLFFSLSYEGSAPPSVHGSRVDLVNFDKGSAIYLGCSPPRQNSFSGTNTPAPQSNTGAISKIPLFSRGSSLSLSGRSTKSPKITPPTSPKKQQNQTKTRLKSTNTVTASTTTSSSNRYLLLSILYSNHTE